MQKVLGSRKSNIHLFSKKKDLSKLYAVFIATGLAILLGAVPSRNAATTVDKKIVNPPPVISLHPVPTAERVIKARPLSVGYSKRLSGRGEFTASSKTKSGGMKVLFLNCKSFHTAKADIECLCSRYSVDLLCLNETWEDPTVHSPLATGLRYAVRLE